LGELALEKKAENVVIMDLRKLGTVTDFFVVCNGGVEPHVKAISDHILETMAQRGIRVFHQEGYHGLRWVLLDYLDVVVHIFQPAWRKYYRLEDLWGDARIRVLDDAYLRRKERRKKKESEKKPSKKTASSARRKSPSVTRRGRRKP
jgi:ribosome-associated protein